MLKVDNVGISKKQEGTWFITIHTHCVSFLLSFLPVGQVLLLLWGPVRTVSSHLLPSAHLLPISSSSFCFLKIGSVVPSLPDHQSFPSGNKCILRDVFAFVHFLEHLCRFPSHSPWAKSLLSQSFSTFGAVWCHEEQISYYNSRVRGLKYETKIMSPLHCKY